MKLHRLHRKLLIAAPPDDVWAFFSNPHNLSKITPPELNLVVPPNLTSKVYPGLIIAYSVKPFPGFRSPWVTEITHVVENEMFVDEQRFGPYKFWHHQHLFTPTSRGVEVQDIVHYVLPFGPLGSLAHLLGVKKKLQAIFDGRLKALREIFDDVRELETLE